MPIGDLLFVGIYTRYKHESMNEWMDQWKEHVVGLNDCIGWFFWYARSYSSVIYDMWCYIISNDITWYTLSNVVHIGEKYQVIVMYLSDWSTLCYFYSSRKRFHSVKCMMFIPHEQLKKIRTGVNLSQKNKNLQTDIAMRIICLLICGLKYVYFVWTIF